MRIADDDLFEDFGGALGEPAAAQRAEEVPTEEVAPPPDAEAELAGVLRAALEEGSAVLVEPKRWVWGLQVEQRVVELDEARGLVRLASSEDETGPSQELRIGQLRSVVSPALRAAASRRDRTPTTSGYDKALDGLRRLARDPSLLDEDREAVLAALSVATAAALSARRADAGAARSYR